MLAFDPATDLDALRAHLSEHMFLQAYRGGWVYNTILNASSQGLSRDIAEGWEVVHVLVGSEMKQAEEPDSFPNSVVLRRRFADFAITPNPWSQKGPYCWLPRLDDEVPDPVRVLLEDSGGHGSPTIARRFVCSCGATSVSLLCNHEFGRVEASCGACGGSQIVLDEESVYRRASGESPVEPPQVSLTSLPCECGSQLARLYLAIEFAVDSNEPWDFTWINLATTCTECRQTAFIWEFETS